MIHLNDYPILPRFQRTALAAFLAQHQLRFADDVDGAVLAETDEGEIVGCIAHQDDVLKYFCVDDALREDGIGSQLISALINRLLRTYGSLHAFTAPARIAMFEALGFRLLTKTLHYALLEFGPHGLSDYVQQLHTQLPATGTPFSAIVMNANPFTLGHHYLVQQAAAQSAHVIVFVVANDHARFCFDDRLAMVKAGCSSLSNVTVFSGNAYMVSGATFPHYFLKQSTDEVVAGYQGELDATLFATHIAPALNITQRFIGEEPLSPVTAAYNAALLATLPQYGIHVHELARYEQAGSVISASRVRALIDAKDSAWEMLVPATTRDYINAHTLT